MARGGEGTRSHADATLFLCPSPTPPLYPSPLPPLPLSSLPALPLPRRAVVTLVSSPSVRPPRPYTPPRATSLLHTHTHTHSVYLSSGPGRRTGHNFFPYFGPKDRGGDPNRFFSPVPSTTGFRRGPSSRPARRDYGSGEKKNDANIMCCFPRGNNVSTLQGPRARPSSRRDIVHLRRADVVLTGKRLQKKKNALDLLGRRAKLRSVLYNSVFCTKTVVAGRFR